MKINWFNIAGITALVLLVGLTGFGAWNYYFHKPVPTVQNYTAPVTNNSYEVKAKQHLITGLYGGRREGAWEGGLTIGWLW